MILTIILPLPLPTPFQGASAYVKVGDRVLLGEPRGFTNRVNVPLARLAPCPPNCSLEEGAALQSVSAAAASPVSPRRRRLSGRDVTRCCLIEILTRPRSVRCRVHPGIMRENALIGYQ
jgi:hypothetical protein